MTRKLIDVGVLVLLLAAGFEFLRPRPEGHVVPRQMSSALVGVDSAGTEVVLYDPSKKESLLALFFQESCRACVEQYSDWATLVLEASISRLNVVAISTIEGERRLPLQLSMVPVYLLRSLEELQSSLPVFGVPSTVLLGPRGRIEFWGRGVLSESDVGTLTAQIRARPVASVSRRVSDGAERRP